MNLHSIWLKWATINQKKKYFVYNAKLDSGKINTTQKYLKAQVHNLVRARLCIYIHTLFFCCFFSSPSPLLPSLLSIHARGVCVCLCAHTHTSWHILRKSHCPLKRKTNVALSLRIWNVPQKHIPSLLFFLG